PGRYSELRRKNLTPGDLSSKPDLSGFLECWGVQRGVGHFLERLERQALDHVADRKAFGCDIENRKIGIDALDHSERGERISAAADERVVAGFGLVLHQSPALARADGEIHRPADSGRAVIIGN